MGDHIDKYCKFKIPMWNFFLQFILKMSKGHPKVR